MPVYTIDDIQDPRLADYRQLPRRMDRGDTGRFIAEGAVLVQRLWASRLHVDSVFTDQSHLELATSHSAPETPIYVASKSLMDATIGFKFHRGLMACGRKPSPPALTEYLQSTPDRSLLAIADRIVDQENLGGLIRNAAALGANGVVVGPQSARPYARRVLRVSMGAVFQLPIFLSDNLHATLTELRAADFQVIATHLAPDSKTLPECALAPRTAVLFGNEGDGVSATLADDADIRVTIPMHLGVDSLNVASASAIILHRVLEMNAKCDSSD